mgnify:CR=1 FL=1
MLKDNTLYADFRRFKFHCDSINMEYPRMARPKKQGHLNSTVILLISNGPTKKVEAEIHLNSTVILLIWN